MAFIGRKPTNAPLTSDDIPNGIIGAADLATGLSKLTWDTTPKTTGFTAVANTGYFCNTTSAAFTVTLPSTPSAGDEVILVDYAATFATNNLTITSTPKINGSDNDVKLTTNREATRLVYIDSTQGWLAYSGVNEGTAPSLTDVPPPYSIDYLVIAGGGGGGGDGANAGGGGGGAGGYKSGTTTFDIGTVYTITVGGGGSGGAGSGSAPNYGSPGTPGTNSSISGTGLTTITSTGGGAGGAFETNTPGSSGGSGGGGAGAGTPSNFGAGTSGQGNNGGSGVGPPPYAAGGGGGASAVGADGSGSDGGAGGNGTASSITGSSVTRAGGGGGGGGTSGPNGSNGTGGGSSANLGGGGTGGQGGSPYAGGSNGGSGVVILRIPTANYSGTTTGSPTVTTDGSFKVVQFNSSGSITG